MFRAIFEGLGIIRPKAPTLSSDAPLSTEHSEVWARARTRLMSLQALCWQPVGVQLKSDGRTWCVSLQGVTVDGVDTALNREHESLATAILKLYGAVLVLLQNDSVVIVTRTSLTGRQSRVRVTREAEEGGFLVVSAQDPPLHQVPTTASAPGLSGKRRGSMAAFVKHVIG